MFRLSFSSLRARLMLLVLLAMIPALGLTVYTAVEQRRTAAEEVKTDALRLAQLTSGHLEQFIEGCRQLLFSLAETNIVHTYDTKACNRRFAILMKQSKFYANIVALDKAGNVFGSGVPSLRPVNSADRSWFQRATEDRNFVGGDFQIGRIVGKPVINFAYPVLDAKGALLGVVMAAVDLNWLNQIVKETSLPEEAILTVVDRRGTILARYPDPELWVGKAFPETNLIKTILTQKEGFLEVAGIDGMERLYAFTPLHGVVDTGLYLSIGLSKKAILAKINHKLYRDLAILVLVAALALAAAWIGGDLFILRKVNALVETAQHLKNGDFSARTDLPYQKGEIAQLARAFDEMAATLEQRNFETQLAQEQLRESEKRYKKLVESVTDYIYTVEVENGRAVATTHGPGCIAVTGYTAEEFEADAHLWYRMIHREDRLAVLEQTSRVLGGETAPPLEHRLIHKDGIIRWVRNTTVPRFDEQKRLVAYDGLITDITERKVAEEALQESRRFLSTLISTLPGMVYRCRNDRDWTLEFTNDGCFDLTGYRPSDFIVNKKVAYGKIIHPEDQEPVWNGVQAALQEKRPFKLVYRIITATGQLKWVWEQGRGVFSPQGELLVLEGFIIDITERKRAEEELRESTEQFYKTFKANPAAISIATYDEGRFLDMNDSFLNMLGFTREEVVGRTSIELGIWPRPEDRRQIINLLQEKSSIHELEVAYGTKSGGLREGLASFELIELAGEKCIIAMFHDLTERKHLEAQLLQSQKIEAVGTLAGGMAHDFNNLLTAIMGNLELTKIKTEKGEPTQSYLEEIENITQRAALLTKQLLAFSRRQILQPVPLNLNDVITNLSKMLPRLIGEHIELEFQLEGKLGLVKADSSQIEQVIMNLCVNARDAMPVGGKLILKTQNARLDENYITNHPWVEKGDYVLLEVTDTGCGMDEAIRQRIFEPFFTTKEVGKGTGLGLSMVYGIIKQHQGYINVYSEPGKGTTLKIYLPRTEEKVVSARVREEPKIVKGGQETILLAEDEQPLQQAIRQVLEMFGYTVLVTQDGQEACSLYEQEKEKIDLVILDAVMPKMGGMEAAEYIYNLNPQQKILFSSGYSADGLHESFTIPSEMHFIQKPYTAKALAQKVREVLEG